jgi:membrane protein required for colicin V production
MPMNSFDAVVYAALALAIALGFRSGLLRSAATIVGYLIAMPVALWISSFVAPRLDHGAGLPPLQNSLLFIAAFVIGGMGFGALLRLAVDDFTGKQIGVADRIGGAALGAVRIVLVAITMVLVFDTLLPPRVTPSFLAGSQLRPLLSEAGQRGFKKLPPEAASYIEQLKRTQRL